MRLLLDENHLPLLDEHPRTALDVLMLCGDSDLGRSLARRLTTHLTRSRALKLTMDELLAYLVRCVHCPLVVLLPPTAIRVQRVDEYLQDRLGNKRLPLVDTPIQHCLIQVRVPSLPSG